MVRKYTALVNALSGGSNIGVTFDLHELSDASTVLFAMGKQLWGDKWLDEE